MAFGSKSHISLSKFMKKMFRNFLFFSKTFSFADVKTHRDVNSETERIGILSDVSHLQSLVAARIDQRVQPLEF